MKVDNLSTLPYIVQEIELFPRITTFISGSYKKVLAHVLGKQMVDWQPTPEGWTHENHTHLWSGAAEMVLIVFKHHSNAQTCVGLVSLVPFGAGDFI